MNTVKGLLGGIALLLVLAIPTNSQAQTVAFNGVGSSALFLELGQAAAAKKANGGLGATCLWSTSVKNAVVATDASANGGGETESGNAWVAWTPTSTNSCTSTTTTTKIYAYLQTDSVVGNRCLFNGCTVNFTSTAIGSSSSGLILGTSSEVSLPSAIATILNANKTVTAAGTDIRPEDAQFATKRGLTPCGTPVVTGSQYLGLGYSNGGTIDSFYSTSVFHVINFALPASFAVTSVGATPIVVAVETDGTENGFGDPNIKNLNRSTLARYLDGSIGSTNAALTPGTAAVGTPAATTVLVREPLSGTYNTMEYNIPNSVELKTSQDVGFNQPSATKNCSGTAPKWNAEGTSLGTLVTGAVRNRVIGTGQMVTELLATPNTLGYAFWSVANFKAATNTAKYLTIDGIDPLENYYTDGEIPATPYDLTRVTLAHIKDGTYPIWSNLRLVNKGATALPGVTALATAAQNFVTFGEVLNPRPDFVPASSLKVLRSHFTPPGQTVVPANGDGSSCSVTEAGGDVGGVVLTHQVDVAYCVATGGSTKGITGLRQ